MPSRVYDTRFLAEYIYSKDLGFKKKADIERGKREKYISAISVHEFYRVTLSREGRETAKLRVAVMKQTFKVVPVDELWRSFRLSCARIISFPWGTA